MQLLPSPVPAWIVIPTCRPLKILAAIRPSCGKCVEIEASHGSGSSAVRSKFWPCGRRTVFQCGAGSRVGHGFRSKWSTIEFHSYSVRLMSPPDVPLKRLGKFYLVFIQTFLNFIDTGVRHVVE